ncbi:hypothetical protein BDF21DRAFT_406168, partial [Thamnidium elegans]
LFRPCYRSCLPQNASPSPDGKLKLFVSFFHMLTFYFFYLFYFLHFVFSFCLFILSFHSVFSFCLFLLLFFIINLTFY